MIFFFFKLIKRISTLKKLLKKRKVTNSKLIFRVRDEVIND